MLSAQSMWSVVQTIFDIVFPPSKEALLVRKLSNEEIPAFLNLRTRNNITILSSFENNHIAALIHEAKFHNNQRATLLLGRLLLTYLKKSSLSKDALLIPMPLSRARHRTRGYNQVHEIVKTIRKEGGHEVSTNVLSRTTDTLPQTKLSREERFKNVRDAFTCTKPEKVRGKEIVLIDDVVTTGATMEEARKTITACRPKRLQCIALAG